LPPLAPLNKLVILTVGSLLEEKLRFEINRRAHYSNVSTVRRHYYYYYETLSVVMHFDYPLGGYLVECQVSQELMGILHPGTVFFEY
jgi:quinol-cytochrome oxidoreductase complex cytochrome b subunit